jgi:hypothetical protein
MTSTFYLPPDTRARMDMLAKLFADKSHLTLCPSANGVDEPWAPAKLDGSLSSIAEGRCSSP